MRCPRRDELGAFSPPGEDKWRERDGEPRCSYCGSLPPDRFMARAAAGEWRLGPTDKGYKVYVSEPLTAEMRETALDRYREGRAYAAYAAEEGEEAAESWLNAQPLTSPRIGKFYFQHLDEAQRREFVELMNAGTLEIGYPGYFYVPPFFARVAG